MIEGVITDARSPSHGAATCGYWSRIGHGRIVTIWKIGDYEESLELPPGR